MYLINISPSLSLARSWSRNPHRFTADMVLILLQQQRVARVSLVLVGEEEGGWGCGGNRWKENSMLLALYRQLIEVKLSDLCLWHGIQILGRTYVSPYTDLFDTMKESIAILCVESSPIIRKGSDLCLWKHQYIALNVFTVYFKSTVIVT